MFNAGYGCFFTGVHTPYLKHGLLYWMGFAMAFLSCRGGTK